MVKSASTPYAPPIPRISHAFLRTGHFTRALLRVGNRMLKTHQPGNGRSIDLALIPAALAQVSGNSEIKIEQLRIVKDGNQTDGGMRDRSARIQLSQGKITVLLSRSDKSASQFFINSRHVTISADSDCLFRVLTDDTTTRITCARGKIYASAGAQPPVAIGAGYFQQWPSTRPEPVAAADDETAQIDITDSLEIGNRWRELRAGWQNRPSF